MAWRCRACCGGSTRSSPTSSTRCRWWKGRTVVTVHDLSFERDPSPMGGLDRRVFSGRCPRAVRRARRVLAVSERTQRDIVELYGIAAGEDHGDAERGGRHVLPDRDGEHAPGYLLFVGAIQRAQGPARRARRRRAPWACRSSSSGPERSPSSRASSRARRRPARLRRQRRARRPLPRRGRAGPAVPLRGLRPPGAGGDGLRRARRRRRRSRRCAEVARRRGRLRRGARPPARRAARARRARRGSRLPVSARAKLFSWAETARRTAEAYRRGLR